MNIVINIIITIIIAALLIWLIGYVATLIALPVFVWSVLKLLVVIFAVVAIIDSLRGGNRYTVIK
jgi:hypothetical protein